MNHLPINEALETQVALALRAVLPDPTPACLDPDAMLELSEKDGDAARHTPQWAHVAECAHCRREFVRLRRVLLEIASLHERIAAPQAETATNDLKTSTREMLPVQAAAYPAACLPADGVSAPGASRRWLGELARSFAVARDLLRPVGPVWAFSTDTENPARQTLEFDDPQAFGNYVVEGAARRLHLEHGQWPTGTLALVEIVDGNDQAVWRRFAVLRKGWKRAVADLCAEDVALEHRRVTFGAVDAAALTPEAEIVLRESWQAARDDEAGAEAWGLWAQNVLAQSPPAGLEPLLREIAADEK